MINIEMLKMMMIVKGVPKTTRIYSVSSNLNGGGWQSDHNGHYQWAYLQGRVSM